MKRPFKKTKSIFNIIASEKQRIGNSSGINNLSRNTCNRAYIEQTEKNVILRNKDHFRYIENNETQSAFILNVLNNRHEYGHLEKTMQ